ncbi:MAG: replication-associated recombination protein A [Candidatus Dadabacteria bacterium]|nr:MAG: replication-associated recombination protein A [Candidatus Dadabacteria bacterium]
MSQQRTLFEGATAEHVPLAERMRPRTLEEVVGQDAVLAPDSFLGRLLRGATPRSCILWGPPGSGKTTIARLLAARSGYAFEPLSAVLSGVKEVREVIARAEKRRRYEGRGTILFVDEIHRFNKAQQDAFLPHVEAGTIVLIGATTENPSFEVTPPLLSRCRVVVLAPLDEAALGRLLDRAMADTERGLGATGLRLQPEARAFLARRSGGDARSALSALEAAADLARAEGASEITLAHAEQGMQRRALRYDKSGEEHYNVISAFIKSMRGGDPDAAIYWLARMLEAGEDPLFIARRMVVFASEDVGLADPHALPLAVAVKDAVHFVGMPEARINLAHGAAYLALAPKSNAAYRAVEAAREEVRATGELEVPLHLRNAPTGLMRELGYGRGYVYPHGREEEARGQQYLPEGLQNRRFFTPRSDEPIAVGRDFSRKDKR